MSPEYQERCVGDILLTLVDDTGQLAGNAKDQKANDELVFSIGLDSLRKIAQFGTVWVLAGRSGKGKVIKAALDARLVNSIAIEGIIANELLDL